MYCRKCGCKIVPSEKKCPDCGVEIQDIEYCGGFWGLVGEKDKNQVVLLERRDDSEKEELQTNIKKAQMEQEELQTEIKKVQMEQEELQAVVKKDQIEQKKLRDAVKKDQIQQERLQADIRKEKAEKEKYKAFTRVLTVLMVIALLMSLIQTVRLSNAKKEFEGYKYIHETFFHEGKDKEDDIDEIDDNKKIEEKELK